MFLKTDCKVTKKSSLNLGSNNKFMYLCHIYFVNACVAGLVLLNLNIK